MKDFGTPIITLPEKSKQPIGKHAIFWGAESGYGTLANGDLSRFPCRQAIAARKAASPFRALATFVAEISQAQERIWIIDPYILKPDKDAKENMQDRVGQILGWMLHISSANDIRILTGSYNIPGNSGVDHDLKRQFYECSETINLDRPKGPKCEMNIRFHLTKHFDYVHDRFAIIDDELWHFGATVGGLHSQVSAATRGWRASDHRAVEFFEEAWSAGPNKRSL